MAVFKKVCSLSWTVTAEYFGLFFSESRHWLFGVGLNGNSVLNYHVVDLVRSKMFPLSAIFFFLKIMSQFFNVALLSLIEAADYGLWCQSCTWGKWSSCLSLMKGHFLKRDWNVLICLISRNSQNTLTKKNLFTTLRLGNRPVVKSPMTPWL